MTLSRNFKHPFLPDQKPLLLLMVLRLALPQPPPITTIMGTTLTHLQILPPLPTVPADFPLLVLIFETTRHHMTPTQHTLLPTLTAPRTVLTASLTVPLVLEVYYPILHLTVTHMRTVSITPIVRHVATTMIVIVIPMIVQMAIRGRPVAVARIGPTARGSMIPVMLTMMVVAVMVTTMEVAMAGTVSLRGWVPLDPLVNAQL